jgi:N-formylglutamate deformylase
MGGSMNLCDISRGESPLVIDVPHAGTFVPAELAMSLTPAARPLPDTDWHVDKLYQFAGDMGATLVVASHSRYVVDLNRDPMGVSLYPGADVTELCPTRTFANELIWAEGKDPATTVVAARRAQFFDPYHSALAAEIERVHRLHGYAILLDGHSIRSRVPRFFSGRLPDLNLGTASGASCAPGLEARVAKLLGAAAGFTHVVNGRFKGGYVTRHYGQPARGVHALQLEIAQVCYMDEALPYRWDAVRAAALGTALRQLVSELLAWRPEGNVSG